ncbi:hypothetical protein CYMTET_49140 [Cymbomonas tetramitiformis]|uniref:Uncharacterized protein n=1 Tax=Cymbomonas tetramitiformis TaxID=36881 RepID=A0AAE0BS13_9CHLO|nr:hypothetical protein CYMTET_49140 [Cymbomonas tetramitiformis]|eukprot:gene466-845_t
MLPTTAANPANERVKLVVPFEICCRLLSAIENLNRVYGISGRHQESIFSGRSEASTRKRPRLQLDYAAGDLDAELFPDTVERYQKAQRYAVAARIAESRRAFARIVFLNGIRVTATTAKKKSIALPVSAAIHMTAKARRKSDSIAVLRYALRENYREFSRCGCGARCAGCGHMDRILFQLDLLGAHVDGERKLEDEKLRQMYAIARNHDFEGDGGDGGDIGDEATEGAWLRRGEHRAISIDIALSCELHHEAFETYSIRFDSNHPGACFVKPSLPCERCAAYARALASYLGSAENENDDDRRDADLAAFHIYAMT